MPLKERLARLRAARPTTCAPRLIAPADEAALTELLDSGAVNAVVDTLAAQLDDLAASRALDGDVVAARAGILAGADPDEFGVWVHYPWSGRLVRVLPEPLFRELRCDRNRHLIRADEQRRLAQASVGVVGLSVGQSIAVCMALEGVGGRFVLIDPDHLELSNLNRIWGRVDEIGVPKAVMAARKLVEIDPFLQVEARAEALDEAALEGFVAGLDLLVEECDDLEMKVRVREVCRAHRVPVLMATSERGMLDIERFDREALPVFHGLLPDGMDAATLRDLPREAMLPILERLANLPAAGDRFCASMLEIRQSVSTWPQLASAVVLGAGAITHLARRLLLEGEAQVVPSGRFWLDLDALITAEHAADIDRSTPPEPASRPQLDPLPAPPPDPRDPPRPVVRALVARGLLAPSGGNAQPWRFHWAGGRLRCATDPSRDAPVMDPEGHASRLSLGCAVENIALAASGLGWATEVTEAAGAWHLTFCAGADRDPLLDQVEARTTQRDFPAIQAVPAADLTALSAAAAPFGCAVDALTDRDALAAAAEVAALTARVGFASADLHAEMMSEFRWTPAEVAAGDGIDVAGLDVRDADRVGLRILRRAAVLQAVREIPEGGGKLGAMAQDWVRSASAAILLRAPHRAWEGIDAGRALQRVWLTATARGWALQPIGRIPFLIGKLRAEDPAIQPGRALLAEAARQWATLFPRDPDQTDVIFLRVVPASGRAYRPLRRPVEELLTFG